jgi:hypothetical protein
MMIIIVIIIVPLSVMIIHVSKKKSLKNSEVCNIAKNSFGKYIYSNLNTFL